MVQDRKTESQTEHTDSLDPPPAYEQIDQKPSTSLKTNQPEMRAVPSYTSTLSDTSRYAAKYQRKTEKRQLKREYRQEKRELRAEYREEKREARRARVGPIELLVKGVSEMMKK